MAGFTNRGKYLFLQYATRSTTRPANYFIALVTSATAPDADINTLSQLTEIANGNGYTTGGFSLTPGDTDFDTQTEDDTNDWAFVLIKDVAWTASGGSIPASGGGARYAVMVTNEGTVGSRQVIAYWDLSSDRTVSVGQVLTLQDLQLRGAET